MSADFNTKLVYDSRLNSISDKITYAVVKGSSSSTFQEFNANSQTSSLINFTITPPSESTIVDRCVLIKSTVEFTISIGPNVPIGTSVWSYGLRDSFQSFPLNRLFQTVTASVNNVSTSIAMNQCFPAILRMLDKEFMQEYHGLTPTYLDNYATLSDCVGKSNNPMGDYSLSDYTDLLLPRGTHPIDFDSATDFVITRKVGNVTDNVPISGALTDTWVINVKATFTEPFFLSPFIFGNSTFNQSGFGGINNFQILCNIDQTMSRAWSTGLKLDEGNGDIDYKLNLTKFSDSKLLLNFLTAPLPLILPPKISLPFTSYTAHPTSTGTKIPAKGVRTKASTADLSLNSLQLEVVPDLLLIFARVPLAQQTVRSSDTFLEIQKVDITFANRSGILSNCTQEQLWKLSRKNGLKMSWRDFKGLANQYTSIAPYVGEYSTAGSVLCINPSLDLCIDSPYIANGSVGQFNLQIRLTVANNYPFEVTPEVCVIAVRSGILVTSAGQSTLTTNILNAALVTECIQNDKMPSGDENYKRLVGGRDMMPSNAIGDDFEGYGKSGGAKSGGRRKSKLASLAL